MAKTITVRLEQEIKDGLDLMVRKKNLRSYSEFLSTLPDVKKAVQLAKRVKKKLLNTAEVKEKVVLSAPVKKRSKKESKAQD